MGIAFTRTRRPLGVVGLASLKDFVTAVIHAFFSEPYVKVNSIADCGAFACGAGVASRDGRLSQPLRPSTSAAHTRARVGLQRLLENPGVNTGWLGMRLQRARDQPQTAREKREHH